MDVVVNARSPQQAALRVLTTSAKDGPFLEFQDGAEAIVMDRRQKKYVYEIESSLPFHLERVG